MPQIVVIKKEKQKTVGITTGKALAAPIQIQSYEGKMWDEHKKVQRQIQ